MAALALLVGFTTTANASGKPLPRNDRPYTITVDIDSTVSNAFPSHAPAAWETGTHLNVVLGSCSGAQCIKVHDERDLPPCAATSLACAGSDWNATDPSAIPDLHTTTCHIWLFNDNTASLSHDQHAAIFAHEVGVCLGLAPSNDPTSLMHDPTLVTAPNYTDSFFANELWPVYFPTV